MVMQIVTQTHPTKKIAINWHSFHDACLRVHDYYDEECLPFLNKYNGDIERLLDAYEMANLYDLNPEEVRYHQDKIANNPDKYLFIECISHEDDYLILLSFLDSDWTFDQILKELVKDCYQGSINGWGKNMWNNPSLNTDPGKIIDRWRRYKRVEINRMMENFLKKNNIEFTWCGSK